MATRRGFLRAAAVGGALAGMGDLAFLKNLRPVRADEAKLDPNKVRLSSDIEPLVRLLEETPRNRVIEAFANEIRRGTSYQQILAALLLAGVRNVQPRPSVGFKFHCVLVVNSAHLASLASPDQDRWLPIFWSLDYFKSAQASDEREGDWTMAPVDEARVPPAHRARQALVEALEQWDEAAADVAVAGMVRNATAGELFEVFARYGARDYRSIGHKAIFVANGFRTLQCIGWRHAEPVLRSLAYALLNHTNEPNPAQSDLAPDRPYRHNLERIRRIRADWRDGKPDSGATRQLLATLRTGSSDDVCELIVEMLNRGVAPRSIYDALFLGAGELLARQPGIVSLHAATTTNAIHYAYQTVTDDETRRLLLLQNAAFLPMFLQSMRSRGQVRDVQLDTWQPEVEAPQDPHQIFQLVGPRTSEASAQMFRFLERGGDPQQLLDVARRLIFLKGNDSHDYKFSSAVFEDYHAVSPEWRNRFLATSVYRLRGALEPDNSLVARTRAALET
ncbi:MAG: hypothetical protein KatS3mg110_3913 [Pirellulaceae bacterium]|nr:MAG: hypothetical protein KatS3mg110_3913 [Pirellulaceae bacterium]